MSRRKRNCGNKMCSTDSKGNFKILFLTDQDARSTVSNNQEVYHCDFLLGYHIKTKNRRKKGTK
jgi:hypothetical protein